MAAGDKAFWDDVADAIFRPLVRLVQQAAQTGLASGANTVLTFGAGSEDIDTHNWHDTAVNNTRVTPTKAGYYKVTVMPVFAFSTTITSLNSFIRKNGSIVQRSGNVKPASTNVNTGAPQLSMILTANGTTDFFEGGVTFAGSANNDTNAVAGAASTFEVEYLRPL